MALRLRNLNKKKVIKLSEDNLALALYMDRTTQSRYECVIPRCYTAHDNECDVFAIRKSGYCDEFEIKISRSDFLADAKKMIQEVKHSKGEYSFKQRGKKSLKSKSYESGSHIINYFWYVVPEGLIKEEDVPAWAGLIYITEQGWVRPVKSPKRLHNRKLGVEYKYKMARKLTFRLWNKRKLEFKE